MTQTEQTLRHSFEAAGQGHVFAFWDTLQPEQQKTLLTALEGVDLEWVAARHQQYLTEKNAAKKVPTLEPSPIIALPKTSEERAEAKAAYALGEEALRAGRLAAFVVAGGQGSRLGYDGPKGCFPIGPVSERSLFQIHAEQIRARAARYGVTIPWYIMTSVANDSATRAFFRQHDFFGFAEEDVFFFPQAMVPSIDFDGKLILESPCTLAVNPDGHGGSLAALEKSGAVADMKRRDIDTLSYFQIDNPLVTICDPLFVGYHLRAKAGMSSKILEKCAPDEKVGAIAYVDGKLGVIEYSDLDEANMHAKGPDGRLKFWAGSIAIHMLDVAFIEHVGGGAQLPWHVAIKKIPHVNPQGERVVPTSSNGIKFETFVFDALPLTENSITLEVAREEEFAPVKNPDGIDSVLSCRQLMSDQAARWLIAAGLKMPLDADGHTSCRIEMSYLWALDDADVRARLTPEMQSATPEETLVFKPEGIRGLTVH